MPFGSSSHPAPLVLLVSLPLLALLATGCAARGGPSARLHLIAVDAQGFPLDPDDLSRRMTDAEYGRYLDEMMRAIEKDTVTRGPGGTPLRDKGVLLFVHGGLNRIGDARGRALATKDSIALDGYYPIFIVWESSLWNTYGEYLWHTQRGETWLFWSKVLSPVQLVSDLLRAVARAPISIFHNLTHVINATPLRTPAYARASRAYAALLEARLADPSGALRTNPLEGEIGFMQGLGRFFMYVLTSPLKLVLSPVIDSLGSSAWSNMKRRTQSMFHREDQFRDHCPGSAPASRVQSGARGAVGVFLERLTETAVRTGGSHSAASEENSLLFGRRLRAPRTTAASGIPAQGFALTYIGHSMGAIILNEALRRFPQLDVGTIVYMGAACSLRDWLESVPPYLDRHADTKFYSLMLHPKNEVRERNPQSIPLIGELLPLGFFDLAPRGSLLVWIDDFFSSPDHYLDRTFGHWVNVMRMADVIPERHRGRISLKTFPLADGGWCGFLNVAGLSYGNPQRHGDFDNAPYWTEAYWSIPQDDCAAAKDRVERAIEREGARFLLK